MKDTIVAIATSLATSSGINIIRISGNESLRIAQEIFFCEKIKSGFVPNMMYLGTVKGNDFLEKAFCVFYKAPSSYTGEDVIEIHCHGGKGITNAIVRLIRERGGRPAEAGEFTKRAFFNNKLTLSEAEGIADMINASTELEMRNAYRLMNGEISRQVSAQEQNIMEIMAMLEAKLDYPEEIEEDTLPSAQIRLNCVIEELEKIMRTSRNARALRDGVNVAIIGAPNAGKSSLLNALIQEDRAIVTDIAGTTRDTLTESVELQGAKVNFVDTAGIRQGENLIENIGIERSKQAISGADIVLFVTDSGVPVSEEEKTIEGLLIGKKVIKIDNKQDIARYDKGGIKLSAKSGYNLDSLIAKIMEYIDRESIISECVLTSERQIFALQNCLESLKSGRNGITRAPTECVLVDIRSGLEELCKITGREVNESIVDEVFSTFCVGK